MNIKYTRVNSDVAPYYHHKLVSTILKLGSFKGSPKIKIHRSYKKFELQNFNRILKDKLEKLTNYSYAEFEKVFLKELNKHSL